MTGVPDSSSVRDRVTAILTLAEAATPPPWRWDGNTQLENPDTYRTVYEVTHDHGCACRKDCTMDVELSEGDASFIAASRSETPWLARRLLEALDTIDNLTTKCEKQRELIATLYGQALNPKDEPRASIEQFQQAAETAARLASWSRALTGDAALAYALRQYTQTLAATRDWTIDRAMSYVNARGWLALNGGNE